MCIYVYTWRPSGILGPKWQFVCQTQRENVFWPIFPARPNLGAWVCNWDNLDNCREGSLQKLQHSSPCHIFEEQGVKNHQPSCVSCNCHAKSDWFGFRDPLSCSRALFLSWTSTQKMAYFGPNSGASAYVYIYIYIMRIHSPNINFCSINSERIWVLHWLCNFD